MMTPKPRESYSTGNTEIKKMAKPNYQFEKRRRDMEKKAKKEEKRKRKLEAGNAPATADTAEGEPAAESTVEPG